MDLMKQGRWLVAIAAILAMAHQTMGQVGETKLTASDAAAGDYFGEAVSLSGDRALVGAFFDDAGIGPMTGSAYVYEFNGTTWVQTAKLTAGDATTFDLFGVSVSLSGDRALVGAYGHDVAGDYAGSAYVYEFNGATWAEVAKLTPSDAAAGDFFGKSVSLSGDRAIVGAWNDNDDGNNSGSAYVFEFDGLNWTQMTKLTASDAAADGQFGISVSLSDDRALVGAWQEAAGSAAGAAYMYEFDGLNWVETTKLTASDAAADDRFGCSVSLLGDRALVGAQFNDNAGSNSGSAYVYEFDGLNWVETTKLTASDAAADDGYGFSVSLSGNRALVGSAGDDDGASGAGSAYVYEFDGLNWVETIKLTASDADVEDYFGEAVSLSGGRALVGGRYNDDAGIDSGSA